MYSPEQRLKAIELYIKYGFYAAAVIRELGYPSETRTIKSWYLQYNQDGFLKTSKESYGKYTDEEKHRAIEFYLEHGKRLRYTIHCLGYPSRELLSSWIKESEPDAIHTNCVSQKSIVKSSLETKTEAVKELHTRDSSAKAIADKYGVKRTTLYVWSNKLLSKEFKENMVDNRCKDLSNTKEELLTQIDELKQQVFALQLEKDVLEKANELLKKEVGITLKDLSNREKAEVIGAILPKYRLNKLLIALKISKSSYYYQLNAMKQSDKYSDLRIYIKNIFEENYNSYGYRSIHATLKQLDITISEKVIRRLMKEDQLVVISNRRKKYSSYKGEISPEVENLLNRDFHADKPNEKWLTDITEFSIPAGKAYLSPIIDCFDGLVVSWAVGTSPNAKLANTMLLEGINTLRTNEKPVVHSDRGCHYRWPEWISIIESNGLKRSMSKKGCSPDNAACEAFFGRLKNEMFYNRNWQGVRVEEFIEQVNEYIEWYNSKRIKLSLGAKSPIRYRIDLGLMA